MRLRICECEVEYVRRNGVCVIAGLPPAGWI